MTSLSSSLSTVLTGKFLDPIHMPILSSNFSCISSVHGCAFPLNYFLINIHLYLYLPNNNLLSLSSYSEIQKKKPLHWFPSRESRKLMFSAGYLPIRASSGAGLHHELLKDKVNIGKDNSIYKKNLLSTRS